MAMCDTAAGYRVFKVPNLKRPECGGVPTGCLLEPPPNACPRTPYVRCGEGTVKKYILNMKNPGCDRVPVCRRNDQVYNNFDEQLGRMVANGPRSFVDEMVEGARVSAYKAVTASNSFDMTDERSDPYHGLLSELVGFGQRTTGGKGGKVCKVTNHGDSGHGSLRHCVEQHGPTWIRFDIDGDIRLNSYIEIRHSDITIDGRGRSVTLRGNGLKVSSNNVIIAHLGFNGDGGGDDAIQVYGQYERIWIHRCSLSNYRDGLIDLTGGATDITVSWNKFSNHNKVMLIGWGVEDTATKNTRVTIHHNWFYKTNQRHPRVRYAKVHLYNNYYEKWGFYAVACSQESECYSEKNLYKAGGDKKKAIETKAGDDNKHGKVESHGDKFENGAEKDIKGSVFKPSDFYGYSAESTSGLANRVTNKAGK
eukprot:g7548.t1